MGSLVPNAISNGNRLGNIHKCKHFHIVVKKLICTHLYICSPKSPVKPKKNEIRKTPSLSRHRFETKENYFRYSRFRSKTLSQGEIASEIVLASEPRFLGQCHANQNDLNFAHNHATRLLLCNTHSIGRSLDSRNWPPSDPRPATLVPAAPFHLYAAVALVPGRVFGSSPRGLPNPRHQHTRGDE